jgi:predicted nucleic acid-binding protein
MKASSPIVYLDTSFFTGLLENEAGRQENARAVLRYERTQGAKFYTSFLTLNEFVVPYYNKFRKQADCDVKVNEAIANIRGIASVYGLDDEVAKESARLMSVWGELQRLNEPDSPRDRKHRWDSLHIATAHELKAIRVYGFDERGLWKRLPPNEIPNIGNIIIPASPPQGLFDGVAISKTES